MTVSIESGIGNYRGPVSHSWRTLKQDDGSVSAVLIDEDGETIAKYPILTDHTQPNPDSIPPEKKP